MPIGETRISEPFDSLSVVCSPSSPRSVVAPTSIGRVCSQLAIGVEDLVFRGIRLLEMMVRESISAISLSSVGWPAMVW